MSDSQSWTVIWEPQRRDMQILHRLVHMGSSINGEIITDLKMDAGLMDVQVMQYMIHQ